MCKSNIKSKSIEYELKGSDWTRDISFFSTKEDPDPKWLLEFLFRYSQLLVQFESVTITELLIGYT